MKREAEHQAKAVWAQWVENSPSMHKALDLMANTT